jgi:hypothetical protein
MAETQLIEKEQESIQLQQTLGAIQIVDQVSYDLAVAERVSATEWLKGAKDFVDSIKKPAYATYQATLAAEKTICGPVEAKIKQINAELVRWTEEQERARRAEQRRLEAIEMKRLEDERLAQAQEMQNAGVGEESLDEILSAPIIIETPVVARPTYEKNSGVVMRENWSGEVTDFYALVKAVAKDKSKLNLLQINQTALNQMARAQKSMMDIPGIRAVNKPVVASGR